jgi:hypothetical protein
MPAELLQASIFVCARQKLDRIRYNDVWLVNRRAREHASGNKRQQAGHAREFSSWGGLVKYLADALPRRKTGRIRLCV